MIMNTREKGQKNNSIETDRQRRREKQTQITEKKER
jgi:hypothetical protein